MRIPPFSLLLLRSLHPFGYVFLLCLFLFSYTGFRPFLPTSFQVEKPGPIGTFLNGKLPTLTPGQAGSSTYQIVPAFPNLFFQDPLVITPHPNENRLFVGSRQGLIEHFIPSPTVSSKQVFLDLREETAVVHDGGLLGIAFHPEFGLEASSNSTYVYVYYCARGSNGEWGPTQCAAPDCFTCEAEANWYGSYLRLSRFELDPTTYTLDKTTELPMLNIRQFNGTHRGGGLTFDKEGFLYLTLGDQARYATAQDIAGNFEGGIIRLDVDQQGGSISHPPRRILGENTGFSDEISGAGYYIPNDNPWLNESGELFEEFVHIGNRSPHRLTMDRLTGELWIGEVGQNQREEISILQMGGNGGWPLYEGNLWRDDPTCDNNQLTLDRGTYNPPVVDFTRTETRSIIGGYVYRGQQHPNLYGTYLCGGHALHTLFAIRPDGNGAYEKEEFLSFHPGSIITFGEDFQGELYMGRLSASTNLYTLDSRSSNPQAPTLLSQTGAFTDLESLTAVEGLIPYELIEPFWSDGAEKYRWMALPNDGSYDAPEEQIGFSESGDWTFPIGTVLIKHFELEGRRLETRFEVLGEDNVYYYLSYKWNEEETDAVLVQNSIDEQIEVNGRSQVWHYPSPAECQSCHIQSAGGTIGTRTRYLNRNFTYPHDNLTANQLMVYSNWGLIEENLTEGEVNSFTTLAAKTDASASIERRARSYLDVNCSYCHRPGTGNRAAFDARLTTPLEESNLIRGSLLNAMGNPQARLIVPGSIENSMIHLRMNSLDQENGVAMPPLSKGVIDQEGVALIEAWIRQLEPAESGDASVALVTNASAQNLDGGCILLTPNSPEQTGSAWYPLEIDLQEDLTVSFNLSLGSQDEIGEIDNGGDGVAFIFQQVGTDLLSIEGGGSGLGASGIMPSVGIEFDTYDSNTDEDIADDHIAIFRNGVLGDVVAGPVCSKADCSNAENGEPYPVRIEWKADSQLLKVYFNESLRAQWKDDIVTGIFGGNSKVYIGLTGAVGGAFNEQLVCNFEVQGGGLVAVYSRPTLSLSAAGIHIFPNPVQDKLQLQFDSQAHAFQYISIYSVQGKLVGRGNFPSQTLRTWEVNLSHLLPGYYFLRIEDEKGRFYSSSFYKH